MAVEGFPTTYFFQRFCFGLVQSGLCTHWRHAPCW